MNKALLFLFFISGHVDSPNQSIQLFSILTTAEALPTYSNQCVILL